MKIYRRLLIQTSVLLKKDEMIQSYTEKVQYLEEFSTKLPTQPNVKEELMMTRVKSEFFMPLWTFLSKLLLITAQTIGPYEENEGSTCALED